MESMFSSVTYTKVTSSADKDLPNNIVAGAVKYAQMVEGTDKMIAQEEVFKNIYDLMGWDYESDMD